jgi:ribonuclease VapC
MAFADAIREDPVRLLSAVSALETSVVIENRKGPAGGRDLDLLLHRARMEVVGFGPEQYEAARAAYRRYGKGVHPAGLNLGACCAYALAKISGEALLAKGSNFPKTDLRLVRQPEPR